MPKSRDHLGLGGSIWFMGLFALIHGINEWVDLLIFIERPFSTDILKIAGGILLPLSFLFLMIFGASIAAKGHKNKKWAIFLSFAFLAVWVLISIHNNDLFVSGIFARYFICAPGCIFAAIGLFKAARAVEKTSALKSTRVFAFASSCLFIAYGILSGLITPYADFFPARFLNYDSFISAFTMPVQFFRTICAFAMSISFIGVIGTFERDKIRSSVKQKITSVICISIISVLLIGGILSYSFGYGIIQNVIKKHFFYTSDLLNGYVMKNIEEDIDDTKVYATLPIWTDIVEEANLKYKNMTEEEVATYLQDMDRRWTSAQAGDPLFWEYLENRISVTMRDILVLRGSVSEIFLTDKYGGIVASSGMTSDFYQADEDWWQKSYNNGKGNIYLSDIEFDESSKKWVISIAAPIINEKGEFIGVCKNSVNIDKLFQPVSAFKTGKTGHGIILDMEGNIVHQSGLEPMKKKFCPAEKLRELLSKKNENFFIADKSFAREKDLFVAYSIIKPPYVSGKDIYWIILIAQDEDEALEPLYKFISQLVIVALLLVILTIPIGAFFGGKVAEPIRKLHMVTENILSGKWDSVIEINTGDEIEDFANTFKKMINDIKSKQDELKSFSYELEEKVRNRTKELVEAQEATLNILEDLEETKEKLELSNKELKQLDQLKSDFISTVSHELRTPLSIIKEGVSLVLDKVPGEINEKQSKILDIAKFNIDRLARIIDSLLDISKIEAGKVELKRNLVDIAKIVKEVSDSFEIKIKEKGLELKLDIDRDSGKVYADSDRIAQVLINLIGNAVKFTNSGYIDISCKDERDRIVCKVKDSGPGISKSDIPKIFDKFQQFGRLAGAGEKGTGLGLSIAKGIIDMHGGAISVESEVGMGSCFTFTLHKYTEESLFTEAVERAIKNASKTRSKLSVVLFSLRARIEQDDPSWKKTFSTIIGDCSRRVNNTLRRQGDELINNEGDLLVILADCNKDNCLLVEQRLDQIMGKCLDEKKIKEKLDVKYGCATFPDDGKMAKDLIAKANSRFNISGKANT